MEHWPLVFASVLVILAFVSVSVFSGSGNINGIKSKRVGDGQHGTARWATNREIKKEYLHVPFQPDKWPFPSYAPQNLHFHHS